MSKPCDDWAIEATDPRHEIGLTLIAELTRELAQLYDDEDGSGSFAPSDVLVPRSACLVGTVGRHPVACGAYRPMGPDLAEIKRMYVKPAYRGQGLGRRVLDELETYTSRDGYSWVQLETGILQPEAIRLYERAGYNRIDSYGIYRRNPQSVCFQKALKPRQSSAIPAQAIAPASEEGTSTNIGEVRSLAGGQGGRRSGILQEPTV